MAIKKLDHVNVRTAQLGAMIDWYTNVLGMRAGDRPDFSFPGAWMYADDRAIVHLVGVDGDPGAGSEAPLKLEHFALSATGRSEFEARLKSLGERFESNELHDFGITQINIWDPDGNHIHVDFASEG